MRREMTGTTTSEIRTELLRAGQQLGGAATGVVLNLIIMTDESAQHDAMAAASQAAFPAAAGSQIAFSNVTLNLGGKAIVRDISLEVKPGEFLCIIGASGCGKTTVLRLAAGLYQPTSGSVTFDEKPMLMPRRSDENGLQGPGASTPRLLKPRSVV